MLHPIVRDAYGGTELLWLKMVRGKSPRRHEPAGMIRGQGIMGKPLTVLRQLRKRGAAWAREPVTAHNTAKAQSLRRHSTD